MTIQRAPRRTRQERADEIHAGLLDAAFEVFCAKGYHATTLDEVAERAGVTTGAVYSRYTGKADLVMALVERTMEERIVLLRGQLADGDLDVGSDGGREWFLRSRRLSSRPGWGLLALELRLIAARDPKLRARFKAVHDRYVEAIADLLEGYIATAGRQLPDRPTDLARILAALNTGLVLDEVTNDEGPDDELAARALELVQRGFLATTPTA